MVSPGSERRFSLPLHERTKEISIQKEELEWFILVLGHGRALESQRCNYFQGIYIMERCNERQHLTMPANYIEKLYLALQLTSSQIAAIYKNIFLILLLSLLKLLIK